MYYLIQSNIYADPDHHKTFEILADLNLPYEAIELGPETTTITISEDRNDVFVYGSVKLARLAKMNKKWRPGSFYGGNHTAQINSEYYQSHLLNHPVKTAQFGDSFTWNSNENKFIKPYKDAKVFTGRVFNAFDWADFVEDALANPKTPLLNSETLIQLSAPQKIYKEARVWIIGEQIIDAIYYKFHDGVLFESQVAKEGIDFAKEMVNLFNVAEAFVMDIGYTNDGWKIVEINCINSAGFYHLNPRTIFRALEAYFG